MSEIATQPAEVKAPITTPFKDPQAVFNKPDRAADYNAGVIRTNYIAPQVVVDEAVDHFGIDKGPVRVADLGGGTGLVGAFLKQVSPDSHVTLVDFAEAMVAQADNFDEAVVANALDYLEQVEPESLDLITAAGVLDFIKPEDAERLAAGIARSLKRGGGVVFNYERPEELNPGVRSHKHDTGSLVEIFTRHGIEKIKTEPVPNIFTNFSTGNPVDNAIYVGHKPLFALN